MTDLIPGWSVLGAAAHKHEADSIRARAIALLRGCVVHWQRSLDRIKKLISPEHLDEFEYLIRTLRDENSTIDQFNQAAATLIAKFPEIRAWLQWWLQPEICILIFPATMKMSKEMQSKLPLTTNGGESYHWLAYRAMGIKHDLWEGTRRAFTFQRELEALYGVVVGMFFPFKFTY